MRIYSIQKENYNTQSNFKGVLSPNSAKVVNYIAKEEGKYLVKSLGYGVQVDASKLVNIKNNFDSALKMLAAKAKLMHPDTIVQLKRVEETLSRETTPIETFEVIYENNKLGIVLQDTISLLDKNENYKNLGKRTIDIIEGIDPKKIDKRMLNTAILDFSEDSFNDRLRESKEKRAEVISKCLKANQSILSEDQARNVKIRLGYAPEERLDKIKNYQKELSYTLSEEENNMANSFLEEAFKTYTEREEQTTKIAQENKKLLDEIFGCDE